MNALLQRYIAFLKTVELGSFSRAAQALQYSQPAVSRMIKSIEEEHSLTLLERNSKKVTLTSEGEVLLPYIRDVCEAGSRMQEAVRELRELRAGILRIGVFSSVSTYRMPQAIRRFQQNYPDISYELLDGDYSTIETWILEGRVDCGILPLPVREGLEARKLFREEYLAVLPKGHPLAEEDAFPAAALDAQPFILPEKGGKSTISFYFEEQGVLPDIRLTTWDGYAVLRMVENGVGMSIMNDTILNNAESGVVTKPLTPPLYRDIAFVVRSFKHSSPLTKRFMDYI